jgi:signal transduction histidine kinase/CheY-like chemotaxis protein
LVLGLAFTALALAGMGAALWRRDAEQVVLWAGLVLLLGLAAAALWRAHRREQARHDELARVTAELRQAIQAAEAANRSKGQFLANMSHELRTPFQGVLGMLQLMEQTPVNDLQRDMLRTAQDSARHLLALLNDILDVSAIEAGRLVLQQVPLEVRKVVADVQQLMRVQAAERGLRLVVELSPELPRWVLGDPTRLKQILFNLVGNALKFTPRGEVRLRAVPLRARDGRPLLQFEVRDTGIGMDAATVSRLFQRFELGDPTISRRAGGAGLGLEISRNVARMMGGDITVASQPGAGSTFTVTVALPACEPPALDPSLSTTTMMAAANAATAAATASPVGTTAPAGRSEPAAAAAPARPLRVVVADDNAVNRKFLGMLLTRLGHEVTQAENGQEAVDRIRRDDFDVVLMDLHMPVLDGLAATRAIRALPGDDAAIPIYGLTADTLERTRELAEEAGMDRLLVKPIDAGQLATVLAAVQPRSVWGAPAFGAPTEWPMTVPDGLGAVPDSAPMTLPPPLSTRFTQLNEQLPGEELPGLLDMFFDDRTRTIAELREALESGDGPQMAEAAHKLKGSARLLGFGRLSRVAEEIERCVQRGRLDEAPRLLRVLDEAIEATRSAVGAAGAA